MPSSQVVPAIIPQSLHDLRDQLDLIAGVPEVHIDVVDGQFVPYRSWPYVQNDTPKAAKVQLDRFSLEVDLMVSEPLLAARLWLEAGADQLVFHVETLSPEAFAGIVADSNITIGIAALNDTPYEVLCDYAVHADYIQVMGIAAIGAQGQPLDQRSLQRITALHNDFPNKPISIDGSVNHESISKFKNAGANRFIVGSAIMKAEQPTVSYQDLANMVL